jgi:hypothetical protein
MTIKLKKEIEDNYTSTFGGDVVNDYLNGVQSSKDVLCFYANKHTAYIVACALNLKEKSIYSCMVNFNNRMLKEKINIDKL